MKSLSFKLMPVIALVSCVFLLNPVLTEGNAGAPQEKLTNDQRAGTWTGSYTSDAGATDKLSYVLSQDEKGLWRGTLKQTNEEGENAAEFKVLEISDGKLKGKIEMHEGQVEVTVEGEFQADRLSGVYAVAMKGSSEIVEKGTWKLTRASAK